MGEADEEDEPMDADTNLMEGLDKHIAALARGRELARRKQTRVGNALRARVSGAVKRKAQYAEGSSDAHGGSASSQHAPLSKEAAFKLQNSYDDTARAAADAAKDTANLLQPHLLG